MADPYAAKIKPVRSIQFRLLSADEIRKKSVMECNSTDSYLGSTPVSHGTMSLLMGADQNHNCATCGQSMKHCPGHPGRIELAKPCFNALMFDTVIKVLRCVCFRCSRLLYHPSHPDMANVMRLHGQRRFEALMKLISKSSTNKSRCGNANPHGCGCMQPARINKQFINDRFMRVSMELAFEDVEGASTTGDDEQTSEKLSLSAEDVLTILKRIPDEDIAAMGFHPKLSRPESMIIECLLVPPPAIRPSHQSALLQRSESDLTIVISNIIKANNQLKNRIRAGKTIEPNDLYLGLLQYHVATMMDNEMTGLAPSTQRTGRSIVSIAQRLKTKEGRVRGNLLGKRVDSSARCVITPDPYIGLDEFGVPLKVAMNITFPEMVNDRNIKRLQDFVNNGPTNYPGARFVELKKGKRTVSLSPDKKPVVLEIGDMVQRHIMDGDYMLFNRQPTLHKMSMMAHRAKVMDHNTFRLNPSVTTPYNADFDGDELNLHATVSSMTMTEIASLAAVPVQVISPRTSEPIIGIVQDVALGVYEITHPGTTVDKYLYANLMTLTPGFKGEAERREEYSGQETLSAVVPALVNMTKKNESYNADDPSDPLNEQNVVRISHGRVSGVMDKKTFGSGTSGLIHHVFNEVGPKATVDMLDSTQRVVCDWFKHRGFSVGLSDLVISKEAQAAVKSAIRDAKQEVYDIIADVHSGRFNNTGLGTPSESFEKKMREILNNAREEAQNIGKRQIGENNRMMSMINSKSKGNDINVVQMIATLGQQIADGKRPSYGFDSRTLPHYYKYDDGPEARGFVDNSYVSGLSPSEFFFHSTGGREGLMDTAVKSVTWDTPIIILHDNEPKRVMIGEWIDEMMSRCQSMVRHYPEENGLEMMDSEEEVMIATMDYNGKVSWEEVSALTRHDPGQTLYRITTEHGRSVTVTEGKSLLIWMRELESFKEIETPYVKVGDLVPLTETLATPPKVYGDIKYTKLQGSMVGMAAAEYGGEIGSEAFFAPMRFVKALLETYLESDKCVVTEDAITIYGSSVTLEGIAFLLTRVGVVGKIRGETLVVRGGYAAVLEGALDVKNPMMTHHRRRGSFYRRGVNDVVMDEIVSIEKIVPEPGQKMYDLTIPKTLNFALANGLQVRDTSESGYIQRKLIKAMEDCKIVTDHTVRNAAGHVVQFQYGEDGMDSTTIEKQRLFHVGYDMDKMVAEFLITTADPLDAYLNASTLKKFLAGADWADLESHVREVIEDRREIVVSTFGGRLESSIRYPIAFERIINNAMQRQHLDIPKGTPSDLDPMYALRKLQETVPTLRITSADQPSLFVRVLMRTYLAPKQIMKLGATKATLDDIYETVVDRFFESIAHPGEMVGIVAAQSIGEPTTQLTLNSLLGNTDVLVKKGGVLQKVRIGDLVDEYLPEVERPLTQTDVAETSDLECVAISDTEKASWARVTHVSRHPSHNRVIRVKTKSGRSVDATKGHGFLVRQGNKIREVYGNELKVGDCMPISKTLPFTESVVPDCPIPLTFNTGRFVGAVLSEGVVVKDKGRINGAVLFTQDDSEWVSGIVSGFNEDAELFSSRGGERVVAKVMEVTNHTKTSNNSPILYNGRINNKELATWFSESFGRTSYEKTLPAWVLGSPKEFLKGLLQSSFDGDGCIANGDTITYATVSDDLAIMMSLCYSVFGIPTTRSQVQSKGFGKTRQCNIITIPLSFASEFQEKIGCGLGRKRDRLEEIVERQKTVETKGFSKRIPGVNGLLRDCIALAKEKKEPYRFMTTMETARKNNLISPKNAALLLEKAKGWGASESLLGEIHQMVHADCFWDPIASIEEVDTTGKMVYDFTVQADLATFMLASQLYCHNTFHLSGIESASRATRGLPRVKELLSVSKNPKQVILSASLVPGFRETIDDANKVKNELETTFLSQLVERSSVYFDPEKFSTNIEDDKEIVEAYRLFDKVDAKRSAADVSPWVVRLEMSKPDLLEHGVTMFDVAEAINDFYKETVCCMYSDDNADQLIFRVRLTTIAAAGTSTDMLTDIRAFELSMLESVVIKGGFGVSRAIPLKRHGGKDKCFDESVGQFVKCDANEEEWILETDGRDLSEIMAHPLVVSETTTSNDINEIWSTLGIEAARSALLHELGEVMKEAYANIRHFYLLVDVMTHKGILTSIDRHGLNRGDSTSVLAKASFEETVDCLRSAALFAEVDNINSVAANIMCGQVVKCGTGGASVYLDETLIGDLPEFEDEQESASVAQDVSSDDLCRSILKFLYVEPAQSTNVVKRLETPVITFV